MEWHKRDAPLRKKGKAQACAHHKKEKINMNKKEKNEQEIIIDWRYLLKALLRRAWLILSVGLVSAVAALVYVVSFVTPKYASGVMLYVNNRSFSVGDINIGSIGASDLAASQSLIDTYIAILMNRTTMEEVAEKSELDYTWAQLMGMVSTSEIEGTEVFKVTVVSEDPFHSAKLANCIAERLGGDTMAQVQERYAQLP